MNDDPIRAALRRDAELLLRSAPQLDTAAMWHRIQRARARKIEQSLLLCGWLLRAIIAAAVGGVALLAPDAFIGTAVPLLPVLWLTSALCAPLRIAARADPREGATAATHR